MKIKMDSGNSKLLMNIDNYMLSVTSNLVFSAFAVDNKEMKW